MAHSIEAEAPAVLGVGTRITVRVGDIAFGGEGVARVDDFVVFIPFVLSGERVEVEITETQKRFARARLLRVLEPAPERVAPACRYFGDCGGCQYQHIEYATQLRMKKKQLADLFERIGGIQRDVVSPIIPCPRPYGYRNRIMVRSQWDKLKRGLNIGFIRADNRLVVDVEECQIAEPALNVQLEQVRAHPPPKGGLKVVLRINPDGWEVPAHSFFQNNFHLLPALVDHLRGSLRAAQSRVLVDAYCGVGFFCLQLADEVESYVGVEFDQAAVQAARRNAVARSRCNGEFRDGRVEELLPEILTSSVSTTLLLDPPRTGCDRASLALVRALRPNQVLYVSCHPATQARDLNILCADGVYALTSVVPFDMFPHTKHIECVADLRLQPAAAVDPDGSGLGCAGQSMG